MKLIWLLPFLLLACSKPRYVSRDGQLSEQSAACSRRFSNDLCIDLRWEKPAVVGEDATLVLIVTNPSGLLVNTAVVPFVELYMPAHHHGSSPVDVTALAPGIYRADHLNFLMVGEWEIRVQLKQGETVLEQLTWTLTL